MNSDNYTPPTDPRFTTSGSGMVMSAICWTCNLSKDLAGGKRPPPLRLFKCADCVKAAADKKVAS